jgi:glucose/arabinose dehydrogenase
MTRTRSLLALAALALPGLVSAQRAQPRCEPGNAGLTLPSGFCAIVVADSVGAPRHVAVAPNGDLLIALRRGEGGALLLRDTDGDGRADVTRRFGIGNGSGIALHGGYLYFATDSAVVRWKWADGQTEPQGAPDTVVSGLLAQRSHAAKTIALAKDGSLFVNIGAPSNACQARDRQPGEKGQDPCPLLERAGGIWRFDTNRTGQTQADGQRWATGLRNVVAITIDPAGTALWGAQHGRDLLGGNWPQLFDSLYSAENPAEELFRIERGGDYGWPHCYYDVAQKRKILAPEYGGDGKAVGRCAGVGQPLVVFPGHWAPNGIAFYTGTQFPAEYRGGMFVAFHGSWNRAPLPQAGFNVSFVPMRNGRPAGSHQVFADGFRADERRPHRPTGLAVAPDGSLIVTDDTRGRVYRIVYTGR